ncbi:MAG TPA: sugar ABC transporter ATP-binding protein [Abditibacteriaceae bacterium]|jgi:ribose transport system ATP-binding protein
MNTPILQMQGVGKRFPGVVALDNVSLQVQPGEIVALIGENGAGKSTLMKILAGVYQPDSGQISIDGNAVRIASVNDAIKYGIGFIHQELNVLDNLDVAANVYLGREPKQGGPLQLIDRATLHRNTQQYLDQLGLQFSPETALSRLSLAEQQMVEIAKTLSLNARIVIMDEPTSSLTLKETDRLLQVVRDLREKGVSIVYISHRLSEITSIADRVVVLRDGRNAGELARAEISHDRMVSLMVGRDLQRFYLPAATPTAPGYVQVKNLRTQRYPGKSVSFDIGQGEILGFAGLVGAGRSEVAQALFGVEPAHEGAVSIGDEAPFLPRNAQGAIQRGIYLVPEDRRKTGLLLDWPIRENISLPALKRYATAGLFQLVNRSREQEIAESEKESLGIKTPSVLTRAGNLSGGNQQKVVLAKWLSLEPKLIILDEPTRGIDVGAKAEIYRLMRNLADKGVAVMMISSDMEEVLNVSDRIAVMCEGALTGYLSREEATEESIMQLAVAQATDHVQAVA